MSSELRRWAAAERQLLEDDAKWLRAGARLLSPSGDDISATRLAQLEDRLRHLQDALGADN
jgi:hypothetical protein